MEVQHFPRPFVEAPRDLVEVSLRVRRQIGLLRKILAQQPRGRGLAPRPSTGLALHDQPSVLEVSSGDDLRGLIQRGVRDRGKHGQGGNQGVKLGHLRFHLSFGSPSIR